MLQRTLEKQGPLGSRRIPRSAVILLVGMGVLGVGYALLPEPAPPFRPIPADDKTLLTVAQSLSPPSPSAIKDPALKSLAELGRTLFYDKQLSVNGDLACASCHRPELHFTDGQARAMGRVTLAHNTPSLVNVGFNTWFHWDGRADSLASQALKPIEDPREQGISRTYVVRYILKTYSKEYEQAFGPLPAALKQIDLPEHALPSRTEVRLSLDAATYALSTLGSYPLLTDILAQAQAERRAPAMELSQRALQQPSHDPAWYAAWNTLSEPVQFAVNEVFANVGRAIAQFERGVVAVDSPFDRFVRRATDPNRPQVTIRQVFDSDFGELEWKGFQLFATEGRCILCHNGPNFTDQQFHNIGLAQGDQELLDAGRTAGMQLAISDAFNCTKPPLANDPQVTEAESCRELPYLDTDNFEMVGAFKTPSLRNVDQTAPYMHDGRFARLDDVLDHYDQLASKPAMGHREESLQPLNLTNEEREALKAYLGSLRSVMRDLNRDEVISLKP